jgi:hypothetical protein
MQKLPMLLSAALAATAFVAAPSVSLAETYTCEEGPCIVFAEIVKGTSKVKLQWSGQGETYDFYRLTARAHGGGDGTEYILRGHKKGGGTIDLSEKLDWELRLEGCIGDPKESDDATCTTSSEKVRLDMSRFVPPDDENDDGGSGAGGDAAN